jgi:hypothetical protein
MLSLFLIFGLSALICEVYRICFCCCRFGKTVIKTHLILSGIVFVIELALISAIIANYENKNESIKEKFKESIKNYNWVNVNDENTKRIDFYQREKYCCGTESSVIFNETRPDFLKGDKIKYNDQYLNTDLYPISCCFDWENATLWNHTFWSEHFYEVTRPCRIYRNGSEWCDFSCIHKDGCLEKNVFISDDLFAEADNYTTKKRFSYAYIFILIKLIIIITSYFVCIPADD